MKYIYIKRNVAFAQAKGCWFAVQFRDTMIWVGYRRQHYAIFTLRILEPYGARFKFRWHGFNAN